MTEHLYLRCDCGRRNLVRFTVQGGYATEKADPCPCERGAAPVGLVDPPRKKRGHVTRIERERTCHGCGGSLMAKSSLAKWCSECAPFARLEQSRRHNRKYQERRRAATRENAA